jgi:hypothetical protein
MKETESTDGNALPQFAKDWCDHEANVFATVVGAATVGDILALATGTEPRNTPKSDVVARFGRRLSLRIDAQDKLFVVIGDKIRGDDITIDRSLEWFSDRLRDNPRSPLRLGPAFGEWIRIVRAQLKEETAP